MSLTRRQRPLLALLSLLLLPAACGEARKAGRLPVAATASRVDVYLSASGAQQAGDVVMELAGARLVDDDGREHPLTLARDEVRSSQGKRELLAGSEVEPTSYNTLVLRVRAAYLSAVASRVRLRLLPLDESAPREGYQGLEAEEVDYEIPVRIKLRLREAATVFLDWRVDTSIVDGAYFRPDLATSVERPRATVGLMYVSDAATNTVLVIDRSTREIVGTAKVGAEPSGVAIGNSRRLLFVSNARDGSLSVVDLRQNFSLSTIPIRLAAGTEDVVALGPPGLVATANRALDTVSILDVDQSLRVADVPVGRTPIRLAAAPRLRRVFVLSERAQELTAIDVNSRSAVGRLPLEPGPTDVSIDRRERELFVSHETSRNLLVVDANQLRIVDSIFIGGDATAVLADRRRDRVYVATSSPPELLVIERRVAAIVKRIPISGVVRALDQPLDGPLVYGTCPDQGLVVVVNVVSGREDSPISGMARPTDVVVVD